MITLASLVAVLQLGCGVPAPSKSSVKKATNQTQRRANRTAGNLVRRDYSRDDAVAAKAGAADDSVDVDSNDLDADVADFASPYADDVYLVDADELAALDDAADADADADDAGDAGDGANEVDGLR